MKRVKIAFPFTQISGKLGAKQKLEYAENNNPAFDAPEGRQYARNYQPSLVICQRVSTGKSFFQIKTKAATKISLGTKLRMALLGGTGAVRAAILTNATYRAAVERVYEAALTQGRTTAASIERYVFEIAYEALMAKSIMIQFFATGVTTQTFHNPWVYEGQQGGLPLVIKNSILVKFWPELASNPITFTVDGLKAVAHLDDEFSTVANARYNVLNLTVQSISDENYVMFGSQYLMEPNGTNYVTEGNIVENGGRYVLTNEAPA